MPRTIIVFVAFIWVCSASNSKDNRKFAEALTSNGVSLDKVLIFYIYS